MFNVIVTVVLSIAGIAGLFAYAIVLGADERRD